MAVRMNLAMARTQTVEEIGTDFREQLKELKAKKALEGKSLEVQQVYVFSTSSNKQCKGIKRYKMEQLGDAIDYFKKLVKHNPRRLFIGFGVEYLVDGRHEGAEDLIITGTDY